jgi:hypothetical protein
MQNAMLMLLHLFSESKKKECYWAPLVLLHAHAHNMNEMQNCLLMFKMLMHAHWLFEAATKMKMQ